MSALKENERYLDSIQGKIDQFNNAMQAMWSDTLDSDVVKIFVELATQLVKIVDAIGPLNIAFVGFVAFLEKKHGVLSDFFLPAEEGVEALKKQLKKAEKDLAKATNADMRHGNKNTAQKRRDAEDRVEILRQKINETEPKPPVDPELDALINDRDSFEEEVDSLKAKREELRKAIESDSPDDMLKLIKVDTDSIDKDIDAAKEKLGAAKQQLLTAQAEPSTIKVNGGTRINKDRKRHIEDASKEIATIEQKLDALQKKKADTIHYAAQFDLLEMDESIGKVSNKLEGMTATINAKTAATSAGVVADKAAVDVTNEKLATTWKELGAQIMSGQVTKDNIGANLKSVLVTKLASTALGEKVAAMLGVTTAELINIPVTQLLTTSFTALATAIWTALAPLLPFIAAAAAIVGAITLVVLVVDKLWVTAGEAKEKLEELNSEINDLESDLKSLNDELETTQARMEELLSKDSLSFTDQEELDNLRLQNEYLEKQIELQNLVLENKKAERLSTAKNVINKTWDNASVGKEDYQVDWDDGVIKKDNFWSVGKSGKDAINEGLEWYKGTKANVEKYENEYTVALKKFGAEHFTTTQAKSQLDKFQEQLTHQAGGINMVLGDMSKIIAENELQYGDDAEINKFLDEYYAMTLKWQEAQGVAGKSDVIKHIFNDSTSEDIKNLKEQLDGIASSELDNAEKQTQAQTLIQDALNNTNGDYQRLQTTVKTLGISAEELAKSFVAMSNAPDIGTIGGTLQIFADGEEILKSKGTELQLGIDEIGESITWENLFKGLDGAKTADNLKVASILEGADESVREQFTRLIEEVENGKMGVDEALSKWKMVGVDKAVEALNTEFETLNNEMFPDAADEISGLIDTLGELKSAFESVAGTMDTFKGAQEEYNDTGRVSIKTALELMSSTDDWDKILNITEDSITLVGGAEEALMKSQLESIAKQTQTAADMAKIKLDAAKNAQKAKEAFNEEANAANNLSTTEQNVNATQQNANITTQQRTGAMGDLAVQTYGTAISELDYAANDGTVQTAESVKAKAIGLVSASIVGLDAFIEALLDGPGGKTIGEAWGAYQEARNVVIDDANSKTTNIDALEKDYKKKQAMANLAANGDSYGEFSKNWENSDKDGDGVEDDKEDQFMEDFQREMDYWENRIAANQSKYEQLQNEIDLLETKGQKADISYYNEQIKLENDHASLLTQQRTEAKKHLAELKTMGLEGSDEWWEIAGVLNDIESELDDVTASIVDLQDAIGESETYKFEEFNKRLDNLTSKLETIRNLIAPNGEEDWFDDQGEWTEEGVAVLGTYIQELETYKNGLAEVNGEYQNFMFAGGIAEASYVGNEQWYADNYGIHSEQEYYDKVKELTDQQYDYAESISDTEQSIVDMYESNIDAVEEYTETLIDSYNDYIDSVKEALEAERDLYDFKKNVQKQSKDIAAIERRIASLSGSTNASDVAERRKLEAQLYESRESLNDTYYDHARNAQDEALDAEQTAYEESMNKFVEGLRTSLETATANMDEFLMSVTSMVTLNANTVLAKYQETELPLGDAITNPWQAAIDKIGEYDGDALELMNKWTQGGFFDDYKTGASSDLSSPWTAGSNAADAFETSVGTVMDNVVSKIETNVQSAATKLSDLYQQILDTEKRAAKADVTVDDHTGDDDIEQNYSPTPTPTPAPTTPKKDSSTIREASKYDNPTKRTGFLDGTGIDVGSVTLTTDEYNKQIRKAKNGIYIDLHDIRPWNYSTDNWWAKEGEGYTKKSVSGGYKLDIHSFKPVYKFAKGTTGTTRDGFALTDEPQFGDELVLVPGKDGNLSFVRKGTGIVPADMTQKLWELAQIPTSDLMQKNITAIVPDITKNDIKNEFNFDSLVHVDHCDQNTLKDLEKMVDNKINDFSKALNYSIKRFTR